MSGTAGIRAFDAKLNRRSFLKLIATMSVLSGCGTSTSSARFPQFRSRPDLNPPPITVITPAGGTASGFVFLTAAIMPGYQYGPMVVDNKGQLVWFAPYTLETTNLQVQAYRGEPVLTWWKGDVVKPGYGKGKYIIADSTYRQIATIQADDRLIGDLHEFVLTPEGTALLTAYRVEPADLSAVGGSTRGRLVNSLFQEVDIASGRLIFEWNAAKHVALDESHTAAPSSSSTVYDFFHLNSIDVDTDGNFIISARNTNAIYKINRSTGEVIWRLNGKRSDFAMGRNSQFGGQHHARHHTDGALTLFDDFGDVIEQHSRGLKLHLDDKLMRATLLEEYEPQPVLRATSQGSVQVLPNGNVFVGWGSDPYFSEYTADGHLLFNARLPLNAHSYRAFRFPWTGRPSAPPTIAVDRSGRQVTVYASWNGATKVAHWDVLVGPSAHSLHIADSFDRDGFETAMTVTTPYRHFAARARDAKGRVLGVSKSFEA